MKSSFFLLYLRFVIGLAGVVCLFAGVARAQTQTFATLSGVVTDPHGAAISGAVVTAMPLSSSGEKKIAASDDEGRFTLAVSPGRYRVEVAQTSFQLASQEISLIAGETRELHVAMALEPLSANVVVTAEATPLELRSAAAPVTILTQADITQRQATSVGDLLATQPGFSLGRTGAEGGTASLFLEGGNSNFTKVLVDGTPINEPGNAVDFSNLTLDNVEKIEIVRGAESALYGSDAVDGVIQIFTRRGTTRTPEFTAFAEGGSFSTGRGGASLSGLAGRFDYSAAASDLETQGQGPNDGFRDRALSGNFGWRFTDAARVSLALRDNVSDAGIPGQTVFEPPNLDQHTSLHDFSANLHAEFSTGAHWQYQVSGAESYNHQTDSNLLSDFYTLTGCLYPRSSQAVLSNFCDFPYPPDLFQYNRASLAAQSSYVTSNAGVSFGYEYEVENGFLSDIGEHVRRNNQAGYLDARWQPFTRLALDAGGRVEDNANFGTRTVPRAGAVYTLRLSKGAFGDTRLRASYGQGIKEPRLDQSFGTDPCFPGNPDLRTEQSRVIHAGVEQKLASDRVLFSGDYFDSRFRDIVSFDFCFSGGPCPVPQPSGCPGGFGTYFNTDLAVARGGVFAGQARVTRWLMISANYMYDATRVLASPNAFDPSELPGNRLLRRPVNSGNIVLNATFRRMNWNLAGNFSGCRTDSDFLGLGYTTNPGFARLDLAASYRLARGVSLYGAIANLTNRMYQEALGYPALGREFRVGVKYTTHAE